MDHSRIRVHNPNYPRVPSPTPPSYPAFSQPQTQQPPFDPFQRHEQRRDPFIPSFSNKTREPILSSNYRLPEPHLADANYPPHQPLSPFRPAPPPAYRSDRSGSLGGTYRNGPLDQHPPAPPLPPPPGHGPLFTRPMPPPPSPPNHEPSFQSINKYIPDPPWSRSRSGNEGRNQRSNASMSINSLVELAPQPSHRPPAWSPMMSKASHNGLPRTRPNSPGPPHGFRHESGSNPYTPPAKHEADSTRLGEGNGFHHRSPHEPQTQPGEKPGTNVYGFSRLLQPFHHSPPPGSGGHPPRPFSQPAGIEQISRERIPEDAPRFPHEREAPVAYGKLQRDRAFSDLDGRKGHGYGEQLPRTYHEPVFGRLAEEGLAHPPHGRPSFYEDRAPFPSRHGMPPDVAEYRDGHFHPREAADQLRQEYPTSRLEQQPIFGNHGQYQELQDPGKFISPRIDRRPQRTPPIVDAGLRQSIEDSRAQHRSFLGVVNEQARFERGSPLPQAVQGAQSQPAGSGRDPGIKSEFGRMFSGLGSGVGSTPQPNGALTPSRHSPLDERRPSENTARRDYHQNTMGSGARGGRRAKRGGLDETRMDLEPSDSRLTSAALSKVPKRNRYIPAPMAHHHQPAAPHRDPHRRPADEDTANGRSISARYAAFRFPPPTGTITPTVPHHHHHHHHHVHQPHHHHLLPPKPKLPLQPEMNVKTSPLLRSISHLPRQHLGSQLYAPVPRIPSAPSTTIDSTHKTDTTPNVLPHFTRLQANSTFTIRIPRQYLTPTARQNICISRRLWGTDVYTDDSDPLAAAMHSGWIRGVWAPDVDVELVLGLDGVAKDEPPPDPFRTLESRPSKAEGGPVVPPRERDARLTLLILPPLEKYGGLVWHGVKSTSWGENHDGVSFQVLKVEWVDGVGERGVKVGKRRVEEEMKEARKSRKVYSVSARSSDMGWLGAGAGVGGMSFVQAAA